jgi:hypothetical protein
VYRALQLVYDNADVSCKDAARLFYGTVDCPLKERREQLLTEEAVESLIYMIDDYDRQNLKSADNNTIPRDLTDAEKTDMFTLLHSSYVGDYSIWRNIGWGLKSGGYSLSDFQWVTTGMMSKKSPEDAKKVWDSETNGEITMGSVIYFLRSRYGSDLFTLKSKVESSANTLYTKYCLNKIDK